MEQLLPIIIIAIISFLLNGKKKAPKQTQKPRENRPDRPVMQQPGQRAGRDASRTRSERVNGAPRPVQTAMPKSLREAADVLLTRIETDPAVEEKKAEAEREVERLKKQAEAYEERIRMLQRKAAEPDRTRKPEAKISPAESVFADQKDLIRGIVMAEVLGRPKAMKRRIR